MGEWIEIELVEEPGRQRRVPHEPAPPRPPRREAGDGGRSRRLLAIGVGAVVIVGVGWAMARSDGDLSDTTAPTTPEAPPRDSATPELSGVDTTEPARPSTTRQRVTTSTRPELVIRGLGGPLLPTESGIQLVGLTVDGDLLDLDFDAGEMISTDLPGGASGVPATILASENWTYLQRWDVNTAVVVPRGEVPADVASSSQLSSGAYRGPEPDTVWLAEYDSSSGAIRGLNLVGLDGEELGRSIDLRGWWPMQSDLAGGVMVQAGGGVYSVSEAGARRVADGELVGLGLNHLIVRACDEGLVCGLFVVDRLSGERRQVPVLQVDGVAQFYGWTGTDSASVSPDGTAAILFGLDGQNSAASLLFTDTGVYRDLTNLNDTFSVAWSDDSRYVVYTDNRSIEVYDRATGETFEFGDTVPRVVNFASRP